MRHDGLARTKDQRKEARMKMDIIVDVARRTTAPAGCRLASRRDG